MWSWRQQLVGAARRLAEQRCEALVGHGQAGAVIEVRHVEPERAVGLEVDQVVEDELRVFRLAIGREPHHLVLAGVDLEAGVIGERRIEQAERMRKVDLLEDLQAVAVADRRRGRRPFADAVHGQHRRVLEGRRKEALTPRGSDGARRTSSLPMSKSLGELLQLARAAGSSGTASPSARAASPCGTSGSRAARTRGRFPAAARISETACRRTRRGRARRRRRRLRPGNRRWRCAETTDRASCG